ncbi:MAG TPA: hypothetical protein VLD19_07425 [Chitinophagaceae bacterium]|nr:hypothetical protein [Chitinophagaceae bacterium]
MIKLYTLKLSLFLLLLTAAFTGQGQTIIAQQTNHSAGSFGFDNYSDPMFGDSYQGIAQTFKSLATGTMGTIQFYANTSIAGNTNIEIYACSSTSVWGSLLNTKTGVSVSGNGWMTADLTSLNIPVTAGNYYGIKLLPQFSVSANVAVGNDAYADGQVFFIDDVGGLSAFGGYHIGFTVTAATTLPVSLSSFSAQKQGGNVLLQWTTATEQNSKDFSVQYSASGSNWNTISVLPAAGNSNTIRHYSYTHTNPATGNNYYRLLQTDIDGKSSYSEVRSVPFSNGASSFKVMANPVQNGVLQVEVNNSTTMSLFSPDGRLLWKKQLAAGTQSLDIGRYGKGVFLLKGKEGTEKILVQ